MRKQLDDFRDAMDWVLCENSHKSGWEKMSPKQCTHRLRQELRETQREIEKGKLEKAEREIIDVANFAFFAWYNLRRLQRDQNE